MNNVLTLRNILGMTQDEFAEHCNVARISIDRYEAGAEYNSEGRAFESHRAYHRKPRNFQGFRGFFFSPVLCKMNVFLQIDALYHMQNDMQVKRSEKEAKEK